MKKFMFYLMVLNTFIASIAMIVILALGSSLPAVVLALRGAMIAAGVALIVKKYASWVRRSEIIGFYVADALVSAFNLVYLSVFFPVDVSAFEFAITGTLVTPILGAALILLLCKTGSRYVVFENVTEPARETGAQQMSGQAVKQN